MTEPAKPQGPSLSSPLTEVKYDSLDEFLSRDPFSYTQADRLEVIRQLRAQRAAWEAQGAKGKAPAPRKVGATTPVQEISLPDIKI